MSWLPKVSLNLGISLSNIKFWLSTHSIIIEGKGKKINKKYEQNKKCTALQYIQYKVYTSN